MSEDPVVSAAETDPNRDARTGRFAPGNRANPRGNPKHRRQASLRAALLASATRADVAQVLAGLRAAAIGGEVQAARTWLSYVVGTPRPIGSDAAFKVERLETTEDLASVSAAAVAAVASGEMSPEDGSRLSALLEVVRRGIEQREVVQRIEKLEKAAGNA